MSRFRKDKEYGGYTNGNRIETSNGFIEVGEDSPDEYYPHSFCRVKTK